MTQWLEEKRNILKELKIPTHTFSAACTFADLKTDQNGLVPVIVCEKDTNEVLMLAYMNEDAFRASLSLGIMTYYSRSRQELWLKGETSGHFQLIDSMRIDCDNDTLLAYVTQIGAACHTGNHSCFYRTLTIDDNTI